VARTEERYSPNAPRALSRSDEEGESSDRAARSLSLESASSLRASLDEPSSARPSRAFLARATHRAPRATLETRRAEHEAVDHRVSIAAHAIAAVPPKRAPARVAFADPGARVRSREAPKIMRHRTNFCDRSHVPTPLDKDRQRFFVKPRLNGSFGSVTGESVDVPMNSAIRHQKEEPSGLFCSQRLVNGRV
jgi:hypothetical protein